MDTNFDKSIIGLHYLCIFFMFTKFQGNQRSIAMSSINCLNSSFCSLKYYIINEFMDWIVNNIRLVWNLTFMLRTYKKCTSLVNGELFRVTPYVTWTQPYIYIYMCVCVCVCVCVFVCVCVCACSIYIIILIKVLEMTWYYA